MFWTYKLDADALELADTREIEIAKIIAAVTEEHRSRLRDASPMQPTGLLGHTFSYADTLTWDELLTDSECTFAAADRAGLSVVDLLQFASECCRPNHWRTLFWCRQTWAALMNPAPLANHTPKRGRGRPRKYQWDLLGWFENVKAEFVAANPGKRPTDMNVLNFYCEREFTRQGLRISRVHTPEYQAKIRTIRKQISDRRNPNQKKKNSENS